MNRIMWHTFGFLSALLIACGTVWAFVTIRKLWLGSEAELCVACAVAIIGTFGVLLYLYWCVTGKLMPIIPRFSIRTMLVMLTLLCIVLGWAKYQFNWIAQRYSAMRNQRVSTPNFGGSNATTAPGLLWVFGERGYRDLYVTTRSEEPTPSEIEELERMKLLFPEARFEIGQWPRKPQQRNDHP
jgi:hypothetical protein